MANKTKRLDAVPVSRLYLALDNPRFDPVDAESKAIEALCNKEDVYPLAKDIARLGINPLELFALVPVYKNESDTSATNYYVAEGNRRLCAIKLLNDPDLAPAKLRKYFEKISSSWTEIKTVSGVVFRDETLLRTWRDRLHNGAQGGVGRKGWISDQKSRNDHSNKNRPALALLDYAEREGMITAEQRVRKLTTVQRFVSNTVFREVLGIDQSNPGDISRTRPKTEFDIIAKRFITDLIRGETVHSRMNGPEITEYARPLNSLSGVTSPRIPSESLSQTPTARSAAKHPKPPTKPESVKHIQYAEEIATALSNYANSKLVSVYHSIVAIDLENHTPLITVGVWCLFETLTSCCGRREGVSFDSFLSNNRLSQYGLGNDLKAERAALTRIRDYGNTTKHHSLAASFNKEQLYNDMAVLKDVILKCIADAASQGA